MGKISHEPAGRGRGSPPYEGAIVSKEDVDILRALLATQTLGEAVSKARASESCDLDRLGEIASRVIFRTDFCL